MKKLVYCTFLLFGWMSASAQNITQAEYWIDSDPGFGKATKISGFTPKTSLSLSVDLPKSMSLGAHHVGFRTKDANGKWSLDNIIVVHIIETPRNNPIVQLEYWIDDDPGFGKATAWTGFSSNQFITLYRDSIAPSLSIGSHVLGIRSKDSTGKWSLTNTENISILDSAVGKIVAVEHFWDKDPGFGKGIVQHLDSPVITFNESMFKLFTPKSLSLGDHKLFVRTKNNLGDWSHTNFVRTVTVIELAKDSIVIDTAVCDFFVSPLGTIAKSDTQFLEIRLASGPIFRQYFYKVHIPKIESKIVKNDTTLVADKNYDAYQWLDCNNGYKKLNSETRKSLIPPKEGTYALEVTEAGCKDTSVCIVIPLSLDTIRIDTTVCDVFTSPSGKTVNATTKFTENHLRKGPMFQKYLYDVYIPEVDVVVTNNNNVLSTTNSFETYQWFTCQGSMVKISGETNQTYQLTQTGYFQVVVSKDGCYDTSDCLEIKTLSVQSKEKVKPVISVFPNPSNGIFTVKMLELTSPVNVQIFNMVGQQIKVVELVPGNNKLDLSELPGGAYLANFGGLFGVVTKVLLIEN